MAMWCGTVNSVGTHISMASLGRLSFWRGLLKIVLHASGLDYQERQLRENLTVLHRDVEIKWKQYVKDQEELNVAEALAAEQAQSLTEQINILEEAAQRAKEAGDGHRTAECYCDIKELTQALKKSQALPKARKVIPAS